MKDIPKLSFMDELNSSSWEHAVFLTYGIDLPFFEDSILRALIRQETGNIAVFADGEHVASQMRHLAEMKKARPGWNHCGRAYSLTSVHHQTAFHPKVALLVGEEAQLWIGSGNLESGGLGSNLEIHNLIQTSTTTDDLDLDAAAIIAQAWRYVRQVAEKNAAQVVLKQLDRVEESIPWVEKAIVDLSGANRLVLGPKDDAMEALVAATGRDKIERLIILSPFHDKDFRTLNDLKNRLKPRTVQVLVQPTKTSMNGPMAEKLSGVEFYELRAPKERYAHAKIVLLECKNREVLLSGSHNFSERGMGGANYEASVLRVDKAPGSMLTHLKIDQDLVASNRVSKSDIAGMSIVVRSQKIEAAGRRIIAHAECDGDKVMLRLRRPIKTSNVVLLAYGESSKPIRCEQTSSINDVEMTFTIPSEAIKGWTAVALEVDGEASSPVPILNVQALSSRSSRNRRLRELAKKSFSVGPEMGEIEDLVEDLRSVLFDEWKPHRAGKGRKRQTEEDAVQSKIRQLSYEDFIIPLRHEEETSDSHALGDRSTFDAVLSTILCSLGGMKTSLKGTAAPGDFDADVVPSDLEGMENALTEEEEALAAKAGEDEGDVEEEHIVQSEHEPTTQDTQSTTAPPETPEDQLNAAERRAGTFRRMAEDISDHLKSRFEGDRPIAIYELEILLTAARLFMGLVGRTQKFGFKKIEYLTWEEWGDAQAGLLDVLTTSRLEVLKRLPWHRPGQGALKELLESLAGLCLCIRAYVDAEGVDEETRQGLRVGLRLAGQILGIDQGRLKKQKVLDRAAWIYGHHAPENPEPVLDYDGWVQEVRVFRQADIKLRKRYLQAIDIKKANAGFKKAEWEAWAWWPHVDSHIGLVVNEGQPNLEILYEVYETKTVNANYAVKIADGVPRKRKWMDTFGED